jgi:ATP synthase (E/31 kDa) subunit.
MVTEKNLSDDRKFLEELNRKHAQILDDMETKCQKKRNVYLANIEEKAKEKKRRMISKTQSEVQNQVLVKKHDILKQFKSEVMEKLQKESETEEYKTYFNHKFTEALSKFDENDALVIGVNTSDLELVPKQYDTIIDDQLLGGFYVIKGAREKYDYTLNSEVDQIDDYLGCLINSLFDSSEEVCDEA